MDDRRVPGDESAGRHGRAHPQRGRSRDDRRRAQTGNNAFYGSFYLELVRPRAAGTTRSRRSSWRSSTDATGRSAALKSRGIAGHSMGGFGAITLGMMQPRRLRIGLRDEPVLPRPRGRHRQSSNPVWASVLTLKSRDELPAKPQTPAEFWTDVFVAAFRRLLARPGCGLPSTPTSRSKREDGRLVAGRAGLLAVAVEDAALHGRAQPDEAPEPARALRSTSATTTTSAHIRIGSRLFSDALAERDIPHVFEIYADGDHGNRIRERLKRAMRFFADTLQPEP